MDKNTDNIDLTAKPYSVPKEWQYKNPPWWKRILQKVGFFKETSIEGGWTYDGKGPSTSVIEIPYDEEIEMFTLDDKKAVVIHDIIAHCRDLEKRKKEYTGEGVFVGGLETLQTILYSGDITIRNYIQISECVLNPDAPYKITLT